ncbi:MAG: 1-deoxy-D-xylulose-5-phosphate reductoisomerase [Nocardioidaceae bacterium]|nr:1-deoxy-D-xylulose-5-phosphate reductoisomerase [Nocardioidaceae bacterium]
MPTHGRRDVVILGSTGSIGTQALELVRDNPDRFRVVGIAAGGSDPALIARQVLEHDVPVLAVARASAVQDVQLALYAEVQRRGYATGDARLPRIVAGPDAATEVGALPCDVVLNAITGSVGLLPTLAALEAGSLLALANKESLIVGGPVVTAAARPGQMAPVDSEHSALAQAMRGERPEDVARLVVTASGGPFRGRTRAQMEDVTVADAMNHPTWDMGPVITINSASLVNKGLEVIEAHLLFDIPFDRIDVVVHPTSTVHSMVEMVDGSTMVQASPPDMKLPIGLGLAWPDRLPGASRPCDWSRPTSWEFAPLDESAFPAVALARRAGEHGRTAPAVYNAANEVCVQAFRDGLLRFPAMMDVVADVLTQHLGDDDVRSTTALTVHDVLAADAWARERAGAIVDQQEDQQ